MTTPAMAEALRIHRFVALPTPGEATSWSRGPGHGRRFVATLGPDDTLTLVQTRKRSSGAPQRMGELENASEATLDEVDRFIGETMRS